MYFYGLVDRLDKSDVSCRCRISSLDVVLYFALASLPCFSWTNFGHHDACHFFLFVALGTSHRVLYFMELRWIIQAYDVISFACGKLLRLRCKGRCTSMSRIYLNWGLECIPESGYITILERKLKDVGISCTWKLSDWVDSFSWT